jgi:hypothetical protein
MARRRMPIALPILLVAAVAAAEADPEIDRLEAALPPGWTLLATGSELVIRHDRPCYVTGTHHDNAPAIEARSSAVRSGPVVTPVVTIELRYRLEPRWSDAQLAAAGAINDKLGAELRALAAKYNVDAIHHSKGRPLPANPDERARLDAYEAGQARIAARMVKLPRCDLGNASVFDGDDTYAQLQLEVDPPEVMTQAHRIIAVMKQHCAARAAASRPDPTR